MEEVEFMTRLDEAPEAKRERHGLIEEKLDAAAERRERAEKERLERANRRESAASERQRALSEDHSTYGLSENPSITVS